MPEQQIEYSQEDRLLSIKTTLGETELLLERFSGMEAVSAPFEFRCTLLSPLETVDLKSLLRTPATISLSLPDGTERPFHAIFRSLTQAQEGEGIDNERQSIGISNPSRDLIVYTAVLVPKIWFLGLDADCKIFQNMSVPDIVEKVLADAGIRDFQFRAPLR
ncbi:MAG TPA: contractile injection system protein, VgrG/Pvc8 family, partial [Bryobacteraceae bacterium]|nr:contractile injection system protein, VgrG/Pvc8 family [Bryobacteraceae bacterium]